MPSKMCPLLQKHGVADHALCYGEQGRHSSIEERNKAKLVCLNCPRKNTCVFDISKKLTKIEKEDLLTGEMPEEIKSWKQQVR